MNKVFKIAIAISILWLPFACNSNKESKKEKGIAAVKDGEINLNSLKSTKNAINSLPFKNISKLTDYEGTSSNWKEASNVNSNYLVKHNLNMREGSGVIFYKNTTESKENLVSKIKHNMIELKFDFMTSKESSLDVLFMGRYNITLSDSWKISDPTYKDCGGLGKGNNGVAPKKNASKAPGLWQKMRVVFSGPKFNKKGNKIEDAIFEKVFLNGELIHKNISINTLPSKAVYKKEISGKAPLIFKGNKGGVAFKNIEYKTFDRKNLEVKKLTYKLYDGVFKKYSDFEDTKPDDKGKVTGFYSDKVTDKKNSFAIEFKGELDIPIAGDYLFHLKSIENSRLFIDGKEVVDISTRNFYEVQTKVKKIKLSAGRKEIKVLCRKGKRGQHKLYVLLEGPELKRGSLNSYPSDHIGKNNRPILIKAEDEVVIQRGFVKNRGETETKTIAVGHPNNINYVINYATISLVQFWNGEFADVTDMWHGRGKAQLLVPIVSPEQNEVDYSIKILADKNKTAWKKGDTKQIKFEGYRLNKEKEPTFMYKQGQMSVEDHFTSNKETNTLDRKLVVNNIHKNAYFRAAKGKFIDKVSEDTYSINGRYFIKVSGASKPFIRNIKNNDELLIPVINTIKYSLIW